uniref:Aquaporin-3 n=1 Tax=Serinus canaria TaxID=9135 RepID=A0A8C9NJ66_SERCA
TMGTTSFLTRAQGLLRIRNQLVRECLAEVLATFVMMVSRAHRGRGLSSCYPLVLSLPGPSTPSPSPYSIAGAHMNPAFSLAMCLIEQFPWWKFPIFVVVQILGSFISAGAVYILYYDAIWHHSNGTLTVSGPQETASIFATYPADFVSVANGFLDQVIGTGVLIVVVMGIMDPRNKPVPKGLEPVVVALLVLSIEVSMGANCGCPLNPARDIGPRLFTYLAGWGPEVFSRGNGWWWVPLVAPLLGAAVGTYLYQLFVAFHYPEEDSEVLAEQGSIVLVNTAIDADIVKSPKEMDAGETVPAEYPRPPSASSTVSPTVTVTALKES